MNRERTGLSLHKDRTNASLGSVTFKRPKQDRSTDRLKTAATVGTTPGIPASGRTSFVSGPHRRSSTAQVPPLTAQRLGPPRPEEPTYKLGPDTRFSSHTVKGIVQDILVKRLSDVTYDASTCKALSQDIAATIMEELKALCIKRYKMVAVVSIGSLSERPGLQFGSRCLWDDTTDSFASVKFTNQSLFAVVMIYGLYYD